MSWSAGTPTFTALLPLPFPSPLSPMSPPMPSDLGARVPAATQTGDAAAGGCDGAVTTPPPAPTCPVCMEPWTCSGDHRICCIPCGHVYGRSCLERWLHRCGDDSAKCPQCGEQFEHNLIINLYAPGNLWDGCCRLQEVKAHCESELREVVAHSISMVQDVEARSKSRYDKLRAEVLEKSASMVAESERTQAEFQDNMSAETEAFRAGLVQKVSEMVTTWREEMATNLMRMKAQMKKMAEEDNATATDVIEFMERSFPQLSPISSLSAFAPAPAPAPVDSDNTRHGCNHPDELPLSLTLPGPGGAVKRRRG
ncbi:uncharacterized protein [Aegilops tauschii subsp. strangulata]|nr:uncharacterized protein LOC109742949 [Aegilops tauschii subsp. strangulata]